MTETLVDIARKTEGPHEAGRFRRIIYLSPRDIRKNRADAVHMMMSCDAFVRLGVDVTLVTPRVRRHNWKKTMAEIWSLYHLQPSFKVRELPTLVWEKSWTGQTLRIQQAIAMAFCFLYYALTDLGKRKQQRQTLIYAKCYTSTCIVIGVRWLLRKQWTIAFEKPDFDAHHRMHRFVCRHVDAVIATTLAVIEGVTKEYRLPASKVFLRPYYCWINVFSPSDTLREAKRRELGLGDKFTVFFGGKAGPQSKELRYLIEAAAKCPDVELIAAGAKDIDYFAELAKRLGAANVRILGFQPVSEFFALTQAADLLVSYYDNNYFSAHHRSAAKLMLYLCAHRPIIMADLPNSRRLMDEQIVRFVEPDNSAALAAAIQELAGNPADARRRADLAFAYASRNDSTTSTTKILEFIEHRTLKNDSC